MGFLYYKNMVASIFALNYDPWTGVTLRYIGYLVHATDSWVEIDILGCSLVSSILYVKLISGLSNEGFWFIVNLGYIGILVFSPE